MFCNLNMVVTRRSEMLKARNEVHSAILDRLLQLAGALPAGSFKRAFVLVTASRVTGTGGQVTSSALLLAAADSLLDNLASSFLATPQALIGDASVDAFIRARHAMKLLNRVQAMLENIASVRAFELKVHAFKLQEIAMLALNDNAGARSVLLSAITAVTRRESLFCKDDCNLPSEGLMSTSKRYFSFRQALLENIPISLGGLSIVTRAKKDAVGISDACYGISTVSKQLQTKFDCCDALKSSAGVLLAIQQHRLSLACGETEDGCSNWQARSTAIFRAIEDLLDRDTNAKGFSREILRFANCVFQGYCLIRGGATIGLRSFTPQIQQALSRVLSANFEEDNDWDWLPMHVLKAQASYIFTFASFNVEQGGLSIKFAQEALRHFQIDKFGVYYASIDSKDFRTRDCFRPLVFAATLGLARSYMSVGQFESARKVVQQSEQYKFPGTDERTRELTLCRELLLAELSCFAGDQIDSSKRFDQIAVSLRTAHSCSDIRVVTSIHFLLQRTNILVPHVAVASGNLMAALDFARGRRSADSDCVHAKELYQAALSKTDNEQLVGNVLVEFSKLFEAHSVITPAALNLADTARALAASAGDNVLLIRACKQMTKMLHRTPASPEKRVLSSRAKRDLKKAEVAHSDTSSHLVF